MEFINEHEAFLVVRATLAMILDHADYVHGVCKPTDMVSTVLDRTLIERTCIVLTAARKVT